MINRINSKYISPENRRATLDRALNATPFFQLLDFEVALGDQKRNYYAAKVDVNKDFYLTGMRGNFGEIAEATGAFFDISVYTNLNKESVYHFGRNNPLPSGFLLNEARFNTAPNAQLFDDRQFEFIPYRIPNGDNIIAEIKQAGTVAQLDTAKIVLSGYTITPYPYLDERTTELLNTSLDSRVQFQTFKATIDKENENDYNLKNDVKPRLILGFGIVNFSNIVSNVTEATILIKDTMRENRWSNAPFPVEFLAPRLGNVVQVQDVHMYWLPVEYFFQPFANLRLTVNAKPRVGVTPEFQIVMLTRTV